MSEIEAKVKEIIVDKLGVDEADVTPEASFTNDLGADSLDTVELIMEFEKEFDRRHSGSLFPTTRQRRSLPLLMPSHSSKQTSNFRIKE